MELQRRFRRFAEGPLTPAAFLPWLLLAPFSLLYAGIVRLRVALYRCGLMPVYRAPVPVISVGNLTAGGTGKTPVVDRIVRYALSRGERPAVISRGYGGRMTGSLAIVSRGDGTAPLLDAAVCGDEPLLLARRNPGAVVVVAPRRRLGIEAAHRECGATLIVLDDGFQHLAVARDLDILLLDARRPFGNGSVLPAGLLREPASGCKRADLCIVTRAEAGEAPTALEHCPTIRSRHRLAPVLLDLDGRTQPMAALQGRRGVAFAGIANPDPFFAALRNCGLELVAALPLDDHVDYDSGTLAMLNAAAQDADFFVTTEKDGVKLRPAQLCRPCYQALLELELAPEGLLEAAVDRLLTRTRP